MKTIRVSTSFSAQEVFMLDELLRTVLRGGDATVIAKSPEFERVARKVQAMKDKADLHGATVNTMFATKPNPKGEPSDEE